MTKEFKEDIDKFMDRRLNDIAVDLSNTDKIYKELQTQADEVQDKLMKKNDDELYGLFMEYEEITNIQMTIIYRKIYIGGFKDAMKISGIVEELKKI